MNSFHYPPVEAAILRGGCCLTSVGALSYGPRERYPASGHPAEFSFDWKRGRVLADFALVLITAGRGEWETRDGGLTRVSSGDALYLVPGGWHRYRPVPATGWKEKWISLRGSVVHGFSRAGMLPDVCTHRPGGLRAHLESRLDRLVRDVMADRGSNRPSWGVRALSLFLECFGDQLPADSAPRHADSSIETALKFIRENAHRPIGVEEVSAACGLERRTLERHFERARLGPVGRRIIDERIDRAEMLLVETGMQIKEIAFACGFGGAQRMIYDFRRSRGITPGKMRRMKSD